MMMLARPNICGSCTPKITSPPFSSGCRKVGRMVKKIAPRIEPLSELMPPMMEISTMSKLFEK